MKSQRDAGETKGTMATDEEANRLREDRRGLEGVSSPVLYKYLLRKKHLEKKISPRGTNIFFPRGFIEKTKYSNGKRDLEILLDPKLKGNLRVSLNSF